MSMKLILVRDHEGTAVTVSTPIEHKRTTHKGEKITHTTFPKLAQWINTGRNYKYNSVKRGGKKDDPILSFGS